MRLTAPLAVAALLAASAAQAQTIPLWPNGAPGSKRRNA